jgi:intein/homing endonuclease
MVTATTQREVDATVEITLEGETIETTAEHPFYTRKGWKDAADLTLDDELKTKKGEWKFIKKHEFAYQKRKVFNFEVEGWHTYFVGILAWLVHNAHVCLTAAAKAGEKWAIDILRGIAFKKANAAMLKLAEENGLKYFSETWLKKGGKLFSRVDG